MFDRGDIDGETFSDDPEVGRAGGEFVNPPGTAGVPNELVRSAGIRGLWFPGLIWPVLRFTEKLLRVGLGLLEPPTTELGPLAPPIFLALETLTARLGLKPL